VRSLAPSSQLPRERAWFGLRAALALEDAELLAAADVIGGRGAPGWAEQSVAAHIARARSDGRAESLAIAGFLADAGSIPDGPEAAAAILAAAGLLAGGTSPTADLAVLGEWAEQRLARLLSACRSTRPVPLPESLLTYAELSLARTYAPRTPTTLPARLDALIERHAGDLWLWALAYDVFADARFKALALAARLPSKPLGRGFALLRLHQLTGDVRWIVAARRLLARAPSGRFSEFDTALLMAELISPERTILPPFSSAVPVTGAIHG
jgi:hypothetical protein